MIDNEIADRSYCFGQLMALTQYLELNVPPVAKKGKTLIDQHWNSIVKYPSKWSDIHARVMSTRVIDKEYKARQSVEEEVANILSNVLSHDDFLSTERLEPSYTLGFSQQSEVIKSQGGYREGAGRHPTGRKRQFIYVTDDELSKVKELIDKLRSAE